ncbi:MAG: LamG domain-containing protein [Acidimicrobiia bacterium]
MEKYLRSGDRAMLRHITPLACALLLAACTTAPTPSTATNPTQRPEAGSVIPTSETTTTTTHALAITSTLPPSTTTSQPPTTTSYAPVEEGLVGYFPLDGSTTNLADVTGASDVTVIDEVTHVHGTSPMMRVPITDLLRVEAVTLMADIRLPAPRDRQQPYPAEWFNIVSYSFGGPVLAITGDGYPLAGQQGSYTCAFGSSLFVADNQWHHLAMTHDDRDTIRLFVDGEQVPIQRSPDASPFGEPGGEDDPLAEAPCGVPSSYEGEYLFLGSDNGFEFFEGDIKNIRIYNYTLTEAQISELGTNS